VAGGTSALSAAPPSGCPCSPAGPGCAAGGPPHRRRPRKKVYQAPQRVCAGAGSTGGSGRLCTRWASCGFGTAAANQLDSWLACACEAGRQGHSVRWVAGQEQRLQLPKSLPTNTPRVVTSWWFATAMRSARQVVPTVHACCTQPGPLSLQLRPCCTSVGIAGVLEGSGPLRLGAISSSSVSDGERLPENL